MQTLLLIATCIYSSLLFAQPGITVLESGKKVSIRGLSVVSDQIIWASGSNGSVAKSIDGGKTWTWFTVAGYEKRDFRDIEAFDENTALIMGVAEPGIILKTRDGGHSWKKVMEDSSKGMFLDAMDFRVQGRDTFGVAVGDPLNGQFYYTLSSSAGDSWKKAPVNQHSTAFAALEPGEAFFASSGTNVQIPTTTQQKSIPPMYGVTGGKASALWDLLLMKKYPLPIMQGKETTGANSLAISPDGKYGMVVGGDFTRDTVSAQNAVLVAFSKEIRLTVPQTPPHGYRSCVIYLSGTKLLACGTSGVDISTDGGKNWALVSKESYHVCQKAKKGNAVFLAGANGRIAKLEEK